MPHVRVEIARARARLLGCLLLIGWAVAAAQSLYKYRDASGNWVYTDRRPDTAVAVESRALPIEPKAPRIQIERIGDASHWELRAINECACVVEFGLRVLAASNVTLAAGESTHAVLKPHSEQSLLQATQTDAGAPVFRFTWMAVLGEPGAQQAADTLYRVPFAVGSSYPVSQAFPSRLTHTTADSWYAIDIALPDGTPVYAARDGTVIYVRHDRFLAAADPVMLDQANVVEILHDDGTIALYAHLHWDSIRVAPGRRVQRGEYIANSGNTGFTTGPHLHFAVIRNAGMQAVSVPLQFIGPRGTAVSAQQGASLTAY